MEKRSASRYISREEGGVHTLECQEIMELIHGLVSVIGLASCQALLVSVSSTVPYLLVQQSASVRKVLRITELMLALCRKSLELGLFFTGTSNRQERTCNI